MSSNEDSAVGGFCFGVLLCSIYNGVSSEDVQITSTAPVVQAIAKCPDGKFKYAELRSLSGSWTHGSTKVKCADGSVVIVEIKG